jgi:hypothetical protein
MRPSLQVGPGVDLAGDLCDPKGDFGIFDAALKAIISKRNSPPERHDALANSISGDTRNTGRFPAG